MKKYCERYDGYYDDVTGEFLESKCQDPNCEYCKNRPDNLANRCRSCNMKRPGETYCKGIDEE